MITHGHIHTPTLDSYTTLMRAVDCGGDGGAFSRYAPLIILLRTFPYPAFMFAVPLAATAGRACGEMRFSGLLDFIPDPSAYSELYCFSFIIHFVTYCRSFEWV